MNGPVLHLLDPSTTPDALEMLAPLVESDSKPGGSARRGQSMLAVLGHRRTGEMARLAGITTPIENLPSIGWADPTGWRATRRLIEKVRPACIHAWGVSAVVAATAAPTLTFTGTKVATFCHVPTRGELKLLRLAANRSAQHSALSTQHSGAWRFTASSSTIAAALGATGVDVKRIRPGIAVGIKPVEGGPAALRQRLGIVPEDGPILLLLGEGPRSRHDLGLWAGGIMVQLFPRIRMICREPARGQDLGFDRLGEKMERDELVVRVPYDLHWSTLAQAADICLATPDGPMETQSILWAMAASVPIIGTPVECVAELVEHSHNGLLAKGLKARDLAARIEEYMADSTLRWPLTDRARADVYEQFGVARMVEEFEAWYAHETSTELATNEHE